MKFAIIANPEKYAVKEPFQATLDWADQHNVAVYFSEHLETLLDHSDIESAHVLKTEQEVIDAGDIIIAMGGDGTMLYTTRLTKNLRKPILGVNSGRLGFMANTQKENIITALDCVMDGNYRLDRRHMLQAEDSNGNVFHALNEFLFSKKDSTSMVTVKAEYNDMFVNTYWADGLIVASPTGSTAYNLSSSGPIVMPDTEVMVLTPINPHTLTTRPLVLPSNRTLKIIIDDKDHEVLFSHDGAITEISTYPFTVEIKRSEFTIDLIELPDQNYFETLRNKLMWGMDFREGM